MMPKQPIKIIIHNPIKKAPTKAKAKKPLVKKKPVRRVVKKKPVKKANGRPRTVIDYKQVDTMCAIWCTGEEIASILEIDYDTLNATIKRDKKMGFSDYYKKKSAFGNMSLRRLQFKKAQDGNAPMQMFLGKVHLGQKEYEKEIEAPDSLVEAMKELATILPV